MTDQPLKGTLKINKAPKGGVTYQVTRSGKSGTPPLAVPKQAKNFRDEDAIDGCEVEIVLTKGQPSRVTIPGKAVVESSAVVRSGDGGGRQDGGGTAPRGPARRESGAVDAIAPYNFISAASPIGFDEKRTGPLFSGTLRCTLKALTPLLVAGPMDASEAEAARRGNRPVGRHFFKVAGKPTIPGTSLKGMIRAAVEVLSAAPLVGQVGDRAIGFRDVASGPKMPYGLRMGGGGGEKLAAGFLKINGTHRSITICELLRVKWPNTGDPASKKTKAALSNGANTLAISFKPTGEMDLSGLEIGEVVPNGTLQSSEGQLVFTGPMPGKPGKSHDYIFHSPSTKTIDVAEGVWQAFQDQLTRPQEDLLGVYRSEKVKDIPVFCLVKKSGSVETITALGLCRFFRLTSRHRAASLTPGVAEGQVGLDQRLFGRVGTRPQSGRVQVSCGTLVGATPSAGVQFPPTAEGLVAGNPAASAVSMYLEQDSTRVQLRQGKTAVNQGLANYDDPAAPTLRGRKLYWHRKVLRPTTPPNANPNVQAHYFPLESGVTFAFSVTVDRVDATELGALLTAIALPKTSAHKLGLGKAFGLGSVRVEIDWSSSSIEPVATRYASLRSRARAIPTSDNAKQTVQAFQNFVAQKRAAPDFEKAPHVQDFRRMTEFENPPKPDQIQFMPLTTKSDELSYKRKAILGPPKVFMPQPPNPST